MEVVIGIVMLGVVAFMQRGNKSLQEHDDYWAMREYEERKGQQSND